MKSRLARSLRRLGFLATIGAPIVALGACGGTGSVGKSGSTGAGKDNSGGAGGMTGTASGNPTGSGAGHHAGSGAGNNVGSGAGTNVGSGNPTASNSTGTGVTCGGQTCPGGFTCGSANGIPVCRSATGIPMFSHVFVIMMENLSLDTLQGDLPNPSYIQAYENNFAMGDDYHGVTHPSSPNYIALTSGDYWNIACDGVPIPGGSSCDPNAPSYSWLDCKLGDGSCNQNVANLGDQFENAGLNWRALGEGMGTPCNTADDDNTSYAVRHVPFVYYDSIRNDTARCKKHVVDFSNLDLSSFAPELQFIAPNLTDDMHNPVVEVTHTTNVANGDAWLGPVINNILPSDAYTSGGLVVIVWDEDNFSGELSADDPIPIFIMSPYAKSGGFISHVTANHYSLLATIEDAYGMPRLANAGTAQPLVDYFPNK